MRRFIVYALVCVFGSFGTSLQAQDFPSRPIQVVVPMAAGSGPDIHAKPSGGGIGTGKAIGKGKGRGGMGGGRGGGSGAQSAPGVVAQCNG